MRGLNTETIHLGISYHIQTQDKGLNVHYIESLIYKSGKLLSSRRAYYTAYLNSADLKENIDRLLKEQHNTILKEISEGKFEHF